MKSAHTKCGVGRIRCFARCFSNSGERRKWRSVRSISDECECRWVLGIWKTTCRRRPYESSESPSSSSSSSSRSCATMNRPSASTPRNSTNEFCSSPRPRSSCKSASPLAWAGVLASKEPAGVRNVKAHSARNCTPTRGGDIALRKSQVRADRERARGQEIAHRSDGETTLAASRRPPAGRAESRSRCADASGRERGARALPDGAHSLRRAVADGVGACQ